MFYVYYLLDPETKRILYIGRSNKPQGRKAAFIRKYGMPCIFGVHQRFTDLGAASKAELRAIAAHKPKYNKVLISSSGTIGIDGLFGHSQSDSTRKKIAATLKGRPKSEEAKGNMSKAQKGLKRSPDIKKKLSDAHRGIRPSAVTRARQSAARMGHPVSKETRKKIGEKARQRHQQRILNATTCLAHF